jgi:hypothetical protein
LLRNKWRWKLYCTGCPYRSWPATIHPFPAVCWIRHFPILPEYGQIQALLDKKESNFSVHFWDVIFKEIPIAHRAQLHLWWIWGFVHGLLLFSYGTGDLYSLSLLCVSLVMVKEWEIPIVAPIHILINIDQGKRTPGSSGVIHLSDVPVLLTVFFWGQTSICASLWWPRSIIAILLGSNLYLWGQTSICVSLWCPSPCQNENSECLREY